MSAASFWAETAALGARRAALDGPTKADVAILGGGYTGLWTALHLLRADPSLRVVVLEREHVGFGASGRNGAWATPDLNASLDLLTRRFGRERARATHLAMLDALASLGSIAAEEGIDAGYHRGGLLLVARGRHEAAAVAATWESYDRAGFGDRCEVLRPRDLSARIRIAAAEGALASDDCAVVHPGRLVAGLADAVERRGGVIHEATEVTGFAARDRGRGARLVTAVGAVEADAVVLAGEAYLTQFAALHRRLLPIYSLIVLTEPVPDDRWAEVGWAQRECVASMRLVIDYLSRTDDGRILFGGRGAPYHFGSAITAAHDQHPPTHDKLERMLLDWFPMLEGVRFSHRWGGVLAMPRDWIPTISFNHRSGLGIAAGYTGHGVVTSQLAGRTLAELILGQTSERTELPLVGRRLRRWEPEPLRWAGARVVQRGLERVDARAERTGRAPTGRSLAERLAAH